MSISDRLQFLGLTLPPTPKALAAYIPSQRMGNLVFTSGQLPLKEGVLKFEGLLGENIDISMAKSAAELCALNALSASLLHIQNLDQILKVVKLTAFVASVPDFKEHHLVANGASDLLLRIFDEKGQHARSAVGVSALPLGAPVEIELLLEVSPL